MRTGLSGGGDTVHLTEGDMAGSQDGDVVMRRLGGAAAPRGEERNMEVIDFEKKAGIRPAPAFAEKGLATHSCNVGILCGHGCLYCSTAAVNRHSVRRVCDGATLRMSDGVAILADADKFVASVDRDAGRMQPGVVELCTTVDAWSPEAQEHDLGRRCLDAILKHAGWTVRVLTKNAAVAKDFDLIDRHRDRVLVGLSITAPASLSRVLSVLEPNASTNLERMQAMVEAHERGLRTFGMLCPLVPGIIGTEHLREMVAFVQSVGAEEIFAETLNARGANVDECGEALDAARIDSKAFREGMGSRDVWSAVTLEYARVIADATVPVKYLQYPTRLTKQGREMMKRYDHVVWL